MRECNTCHEVKALTEFRGYRKRCKKCYHKRMWVWFKNNPIKVMLQSAKHRAKRDGLPFSLIESDITIPEICPVLGYKLQPGNRKSHEFAPTIDRIRPELGYVPGNIIIVSYRANRIKNDATLVELTRIITFYTEAQERQWASLTESAK
jgi:hypothetical protein